jgi:predicted AAA+ superfamily ATPase
VVTLKRYLAASREEAHFLEYTLENREYAMLNRPEYLQRLDGFRDKAVIKVVTGIRRCGKSTLFRMYMDYLRNSGVAENQIIFVNFEDINNEYLAESRALHDYVTEKALPGKMNYVFLDEIQVVKDFERAVNSLQLRDNLDIYITGSNAYFLSGELATFLSGRYIAIEMLPLSFKEYRDYYQSAGETPQTERLYMRYLRFSSFPYTIELGEDAEKIKAYLDGIIDTVLLKDVVARKRIADVSALQRLLKFIFSNIGSLTSSKKIADSMTSSGYKISIPTVESYLAALCDSYIVYKANRMDVQGKEYLKANDKYYAADMGLRFCFLGDKEHDEGYILENIVFLELKRRGYTVFVGKLENAEVDFIAVKSGAREYYQVSLTVRDETTYEREMAPLKRIRDNYPKYLLTLDMDPPANIAGIHKMNALDFLLA